MDTERRLPGMEDDSEYGDFVVRFPEVNGDALPQDAEYCLVTVNGETRRVRFHDYHEIYRIQGLYEHIFYETLECQSPALMGVLLAHEAERSGMELDELSVLDVGAGNGIMGEVLAECGVEQLVGIDILPEAAMAARRDRPGLYARYFPVDLLELPRPVHAELRERSFNALTMIAALGFGDIPPEAFTVAYNLVDDGGLVAFNLKEEFLDGEDASGFARLIDRMLSRGWLQERLRVRYVHRLSISGEPLFYTGIVGRKQGDIPTQRAGLRGDN